MVERNTQIESYLLSLPVPERARLAELLLSSLESAGEHSSPLEYEAAWRAEAERRLAHVREGTIAGIPATEVFDTLRTPKVP